MDFARHITVRAVRHRPPTDDWIVCEIEGGYTVRCGDAVLCTVNARTPRRFRSLDTVLHALKEELGVTRFHVEAMKS
jgi:hypothetical protein